MSIIRTKKKSIAVYCGTGNNGGDGLAITQLLFVKGYKSIKVFVARFSDKASDDFKTNLARLKELKFEIIELSKAADVKKIDSDIIIDALLGSGLNKPLTGEYKTLVEALNESGKPIVSVDVPTGLFTEGEADTDATTIHSELTITFQQPKINYLLPESKQAIKNWVAVDIGIDKTYIDALDSTYQYIQREDIVDILKPRGKFSNKGTYGHALVIAGQPETMGAALLCSSACMHAGAGLTTACIPQSGLTALNNYQPEVMVLPREEHKKPKVTWGKFTTVGIGPGLGKEKDALEILTDLLENFNKPFVVDADALNLLSVSKDLLEKLPENSVITPHMKEFDRLFGEHKNWWQRLQTAAAKAAELKINIVLKNDYTIIASPKGKVYFNSTSNAAMASGGMGDVLTGIITAFIAQKYPPVKACLIGVYVHGLAGDELALPNKKTVVLAGEVMRQVPATIANLLK
ncbi:NAD(P)H-hydrate dehydratase [Mucilaginibacter ginkgonis]|uniref:NAD(P)H-hydrate dehydratase n=1 Tax=Mucilaginibacter ginkgonis TaxID=2682091 RepID=UPI001FC80925|nr:NAD(P)H-hydrate dehydratase [Mucilaginibacter ginkgonis]